MAGYVDVPHSTYDEWRANTIGNEYDLDGQAGYQCWDYASLFWRNLGFPAGYPLTGNHYAYGCWTLERYQNLGTSSIGVQFELVELLATVKKGDIVVLDQGRYTGDVAGHIAFADEDYQGGNTLRLVGQNQEHPSASVGYKVTADDMSMTKFLGAFRYKGWHQPVPPTPTRRKSKFPWFLYTNKLNKMRTGN